MPACRDHPTPPAPRPHEERVNAASHALGVLAALVVLPVLASQGAAPVAAIGRPGLLVFLASMGLMFGASAVFHALPAGRGKDWMRRVDHAAIFIAIAGSYTPFALLRLDAGVPVVAGLLAVWGLALAGVALKLAGVLRSKPSSTALYLAFGWLVALQAWPMLGALPRLGLALLLAGGLAYTVGSAFFLLDRRLRYGHFIWHLFVMAGSACHCAAVLSATA